MFGDLGKIDSNDIEETIDFEIRRNNRE